LIIAEIGCNFMGDMDLAVTMITEAQRAGADLAKFQLYNADKLARTPEQHKALKQAELTFNQAQALFEYGKANGIEVFFSVFDVERVLWCKKMGVEIYKVAASMRDSEVIDALCLDDVIVSIPLVKMTICLFCGIDSIASRNTQHYWKI